jgi:hypothetical protein
MGRRPSVDHDARRAELLELVDGRRSIRDLARILAPIWDIAVCSCEDYLPRYLRKMEKDGKIHRANSKRAYQRGMHPLKLHALEKPVRMPARIPLPIVMEDEMKKAFVPTEVWTPAELLAWLSQLHAIPPHRLQDVVTEEGVSRSVASMRAILDELDQLKKELNRGRP